MDGTILIADDDRTIRTVLTQALTRAGCKVHATSSMVTLMRWVSEGKGDLVITDVIMPDGNGLDALPQIKAARPALPVIVISAQNTIMTTIQATEKDAFDYLPKPFDLPDLMKRAAQALEVKTRARFASAPPPKPTLASTAADLPLIGASAEMQTVFRLVARIMNADLNVLIRGESGSGKSLIARVIHDISDRRARPFVIVGSQNFTADKDLREIIAKARGGSVLFDELNDFDLDAQRMIVRILDDLPDPAPRILATTRADLNALIDDGAFREDLYYRICAVTISVPPLRERVEDIPKLTNHFFNLSEIKGGQPRPLSKEAEKMMRGYSWPGNVRQLENTIYRLALSGEASAIDRQELEQALGAQNMSSNEATLSDSLELSTIVERYLLKYFDLHGAALPPAGLYQRIMREVETPLIEVALEATGGNQAKCADLLAINRNTLRKKISDLDIRVTRRRRLM